MSNIHRVFTSRLSGFEESGDLIVASVDVPAQQVNEVVVTAATNPMSLVGKSNVAATDVVIPAGSKWAFRAQNPIVVTASGSELAYLVPVDGESA
jgi:hypothetical protein